MQPSQRGLRKRDLVCRARMVPIFLVMIPSVANVTSVFIVNVFQCVRCRL